MMIDLFVPLSDGQNNTTCVVVVQFFRIIDTLLICIYSLSTGHVYFTFDMYFVTELIFSLDQ